MNTEETKGGQARVVLTSVMTVSALIFLSQFVIGTKRIDLGFATISILPMLFAVMFGMALSVKGTKDKIKAWGKVFTEKEEGFCGKMVGYCLLVLGTQYAGMIIPNLEMIIDAGVPLLFQELGNLLPILIAIPLAVKFQFGRKAIGACSSISREPSIAVIQGKFGTGSPEYVGVLAIYLCGSVIGTCGSLFWQYRPSDRPSPTGACRRFGRRFWLHAERSIWRTGFRSGPGNGETSSEYCCGI